MSKMSRAVALVALCGMAGSAMAQDSVAKGAATLPGDALDAWGAQQIEDYVVDLAPLFTSGGTTFGIAPIIKSSKTSSGFASTLLSAQSISQVVLTGVPYTAASYDRWTAPGFGINSNAAINDPGTPIARAGLSSQFAAAFAEFATGDGGFDVNNIVGGIVNFDPALASRLYVRRVQVVNNASDGLVGDDAQFGLGSVDSNGNVHFRWDAFGSAGPNPVPNDPSVGRITMGSRNGSVNRLSNAGFSQTGQGIYTIANPGQVGTPNIIPQSVAGRPVLLSQNFNRQYIHEEVAGLPTVEAADAHIAAPSSDTRGSLAFRTINLLNTPGAAGTIGTLTKDAGGSDTKAIALASVEADGDLLTKVAIQAPASFSDPINPTGPQGQPSTMSGPFDGYRSQAGARGGNSQVALGQTRSGLSLVAATVYDDRFGGAVQDNPHNGIAVYRFDPANPQGGTWALAAWNNPVATEDGKPIYGLGNNVIGRVSASFENPPAPFGPSIGGVSFDAAGNVWLLSSVALDKTDGMGIPFVDYDVALLRGIYTELGGGQFGYRLELVLELGDVFTGVNSGTKYQIQFLEIADSNSVGSGTFWSSNAATTSWNNVSLAGLAQNDPRSNGGVVVGASIVYDTNGDDMFDDEVDQEYNSLLYVGYAWCPGDWNRDGSVNSSDFLAYLNDYSTQVFFADLNGDGLFNSSDFLEFLNRYSSCQ
ncbi:MAG: GC-type dockerin domain-anchored protein [Phycisphaerales bacterium]|nr:GC-type dockerin domain-anchored protein [Phycisphaerales bacterium]